MIVDTANGYALGEQARCVSYFEGLFKRCEDTAALAADIAYFDSLVTTSDGSPVQAWLTGQGR